MDLKLEGKTELITGSSAGIGERIAILLARERVRVIVHGRDRQRTERVAQSIREQGGNASIVTGDLSSDAGVDGIVHQMESLAVSADILINNAAIYENRTWDETTPDNWQTMYNINLCSAIRMIRCALPGMKSRNWGRIIQISTGEAMAPTPHMMEYAAAKAALSNVTVSLAQLVAYTGITVNTVSPGIIVTAGLQKFFQKTAAERGWGSEWKEIESHILRETRPNSIGRLGLPDDVANVVAFLASSLAAFISGANIRVDGGASRFLN